MPVCEILSSEESLSLNQKQIISERLTPLLLEAEGFVVNPISRSLCYINYVESKSIYIGGQFSEKGKIVIKIHVFSNAYSEEVKKQLLLDITKIFIEEDDFTREQNGNNVWCIIIPIEDNNFGAGGMIATLEQTMQFVNSFREAS